MATAMFIRTALKHLRNLIVQMYEKRDIFFDKINTEISLNNLFASANIFFLNLHFKCNFSKDELKVNICTLVNVNNE